MFSIKKWLGLVYYVSGLDQFLQRFRKTHPTHTASQQKEIDKYQRIYQLRDHPINQQEQQQFWKDF